MMITSKMKKSLEDWKMPPCSSSDVFKRSCIFNFCDDRTVQTVEKETPISEGYSSFPLFTHILPRRVNRNKVLDHLHVGIVQVALKPTKLGSKTSAIICLRDRRHLKFDQSVLGMVDSSLSDGPIYFSYVPSHCVSLNDPTLSSTFVIDIKIQGSDTMPSGDGNLILMYKSHYKVTEAGISNPRLSRNLVDEAGETTLFLTNVARSNLVVSKKIYWNKISVPQKWTVRNSDSASSAAVEEGAVGDVRIDWREAAEEHVLKVDVPGFKKEEVRVEVEDGKILQISGERSKREEEENDTWHRLERSSGRFLRRLTLPENAKMDGVKAAVENGVLTVTVPKVKVIHISG